MSTPARTIVVSELFAPEIAATAHYVTMIAHALAEQSETVVVCAQPTYLRYGTRAPDVEKAGNLSIYRVKGFSGSKSGLLGRLLSASAMSCVMAWRLIRLARRDDVIVVLTNPPHMPLVAALVARLRGCPLVVIVHDLYPEVLAIVGLVPPNSATYRAIKALLAWPLRSARVVVALSLDMAGRLQGRISPHTRLEVVHHWADLDRVEPIDKKHSILRTRLGLQGKFVVQLMGTLGRTHDVDIVAEAAELLIREDHIRFLVVSRGVGAEALRMTCTRRKLTNVVFEPPCEPDELSDCLAACDVALIPLGESMVGISTPSRYYNILASGRPIVYIASAASEQANLLESNEAGWLVSDDTAQPLISLVERLAANPDEVAYRSGKARTLALTRFQREPVLSRYRTLVAECLIDLVKASTDLATRLSHD